MSLISTITSFIPGFSWVTLAVVGVGLLGAASGGAYIGYHWEANAVLSLKLDAAQARTEGLMIGAADQRAQDQVDIDAAVKEAQAQAKVEVQTVTITKEVPKYVTVHQDAIACVPVGLARVMRAAAAGADPSAVVLTPGQSDDACSDVTATEMAGWFTAYAGAAQANSEQLNALEAWAIANHAAQENVK